MSTGKKSQASSPCAWVRQNTRQDVSKFGGAGLRPRVRKIRGTVAWLTL